MPTKTQAEILFMRMPRCIIMLFIVHAGARPAMCSTLAVSLNSSFAVGVRLLYGIDQGLFQDSQC